MNTLKFGNGEWYGKKDTILAYNDENSNFKPLAFNFERNTSATRINKDGLIETVGSGEPRIDYKDDSKGALKLEPTRSNLITHSEDLSNFTQTNTSTTDNVAISPSGILNASKTVPNTSNTFHWIGESYSVSSSVYTQSIFAKADTYSHLFMILRTDGGANRYAVKIDLSNGTIVNDLTLGIPTNTSYKIENYGNGWYRCSISSNHSSGSVIPLYSASVGGALTSINNEFQGDGTSGIYIYGAQLEQGSYATSYIPTSGGVVTRNIDSCLQGGFQDKNIFGSTQGTVVLEFKWDIGSYVFDLTDASTIRLRLYNDNNTTWRIRDNTGASWYYTGFSITQGQKVKIGIKWNGTEVIAFQNGFKSTNTATFSSNMAINSITTNKLNNTSNIQFYNTALTDQELINLTKI